MGESAMSAYSSVARSPLSMRRLMMSVGRGSCPCARHGKPAQPVLPSSCVRLRFEILTTLLQPLKLLFTVIKCCTAGSFWREIQQCIEDQVQCA